MKSTADQEKFKGIKIQVAPGSIFDSPRTLSLFPSGPKPAGILGKFLKLYAVTVLPVVGVKEMKVLLYF
jgi:hypothetical protein